MDVSRSFLWPLVTGVAAAVALVVGVAYFAKTFSHNDLAAAPAVTVGPAALTVAAADAALQRGDRRAALSQAQAAVNLGPLDASVVQHAGQIARDAGDLQAAQQDFTLAEIAAPHNAASYVALSDIFVREGKPRAAEAPLHFGLVRNPGAAMLHYNLALLELARGDEGDAIKDFRAEPKSSPVYGAAQIGLAMTPHHASSGRTPAPPTRVAVVTKTEPEPLPQSVRTPAPVIPVAAPLPEHTVVAPVVVPPAAPPPRLPTPRPAPPEVRQTAPRRVVAVRPPRRAPTPSASLSPAWVPVPRPVVPRELLPVSTITAPPPASDKLRPVETVTAAPPAAPTDEPTPQSSAT